MSFDKDIIRQANCQGDISFGCIYIYFESILKYATTILSYQNVYHWKNVVDYLSKCCNRLTQANVKTSHINRRFTRTTSTESPPSTASLSRGIHVWRVFSILHSLCKRMSHWWHVLPPQICQSDCGWNGLLFWCMLRTCWGFANRYPHWLPRKVPTLRKSGIYYC